ncbi:MAG TPA: hypothetical protein VE934_11935 [Polaromonas sp.]|uniref:hypothetical protein n=1 Tax=Polaromonas sp. TaxID=1869339 RepID=UPI002D352387|nr:hypothetical protein [Polaromonas sp.]HYW57665.1 hypothetical protein [Polaromonas sp.]
MIYLYIALAWLANGFIGTALLYIGYGFVMAAKFGRDRKDVAYRSQRKIIWFDGFLALVVILWDAWMNYSFYAWITLDLRPKTLFVRKVFKSRTVWLPQLVTGRMDAYGLDPAERPFRRNIAAFIAALTASKEQRGYHVKGTFPRLTWLD